MEDFRLNYRGLAATLPMQSEYARPRPVNGSTDSEDFRSDLDDSTSGGEKNGVEDNEYVVMIQGKDMEVEGGHSTAKDKEARIREELLAKMAYLPRETTEEIVEFFVKGGSSCAISVWLAPRKCPVETLV